MAIQRSEKRQRVRIETFEKCKYFMNAEDYKNKEDLEYDITGFELIDGVDGMILEKDFDKESRDIYHDYLVLHLTDGDTATFRNSYVDIFSI